MRSAAVQEWIDRAIAPEEIERYLDSGRDFIDEERIERELEEARNPDPKEIRDILAKSREIETLEPRETAALLNVKDPELWEEMGQVAGEIKRKVYDNRIVTFAPLYCSNLCVNNCLYCGFREGNPEEIRRTLSMEEIRKETEVLTSLGHKRLIVVYGEHPLSDASYMARSIETIYSVQTRGRKGVGQIRRVNVNAAPLKIEDFKPLREVGIGTFQVFQETYHRKRYGELHPGTIKGNYRWRLYAMHRAMEAGVDDVGIGALFGLYSWPFEVMGLVYHARELERRFDGVGPHTISFPRLNPSGGNQLSSNTPYRVFDEDLKKIIIVLRLSVPYTGMILTAREPGPLRHQLLPYGITQTDASTCIGIGGYTEALGGQKEEKQQFILGDTRSLDEVIREYAEMGLISSFCTAGYRCGRTGDKIMGLLKSGREGKFCKLNAVLTFREWLDDYASEETRKAGERVIARELAEIGEDSEICKMNLLGEFGSFYERISRGERDLYI